MIREVGQSRTSGVRDQASQRLVDCTLVTARPDQRGDLGLQVHLTPLASSRMRPEDRTTMTVVALLDGLQTDVGALGKAPRAVLGVGQVADLEARFTGLPRDGRPYALLIYMLSGEGQPSWDERTGGRAAWARSPVCLAQARW